MSQNGGCLGKNFGGFSENFLKYLRRVVGNLPHTFQINQPLTHKPLSKNHEKFGKLIKKENTMKINFISLRTKENQYLI